MMAQYLQEKGVESQSQQPAGLSQEFDKYKAKPLVQPKADPLAFWLNEERDLPKLSKLARRYLSPPVSSIPSVRLFSKAGSLYEAKRNRLAPDKAEMMLVPRGNLPLLKFDY